MARKLKVRCHWCGAEAPLLTILKWKAPGLVCDQCKARDLRLNQCCGRDHSECGGWIGPS